MKTKIILFLLLTLSIKSYTQKKDTVLQTVIYEFAKGEYKKYDIKPKRGKPINLKFKNINLFLRNQY